MVKPAGLFSNRYKLEDIPDLTGKVALVVGGSRGIGEALVMALVQKNCHVHILGATEAHLSEAISNARTILNAAPPITPHQVDLGNLSSLKKTITSLSESLSKLDILYLIAGIGVAPYGLTADGLGNHFGVNNVSQVLIIDLLYPLLARTAEGYAGTPDEGTVRIVSESSELHRAAPSDLKCESVAEMGEQNKDMDETKLYGRSKLCNIYIIAHLSTIIPATPTVIPISTHPGAVSTEQQQGATEAYGILGKVLEVVAPSVFMEAEQGAESACWAGTSSELNSERKGSERFGRYFSEADGKVGTESSQAQDPELARKLWLLCVEAIKDKIDYDVKLVESPGVNTVKGVGSDLGDL